MTITTTCTCGASFRVRADAVGKKFRCRECDNVFIVQAPARRSRPASRRRKPVEHQDDDHDELETDDYDEYGTEDYESEDYGDDEPAERTGERFHSASGRHKVLMMACDVSVDAITPKRLQKACDALSNYLASSPDVFKQSEIRLAVRSTVKDVNRADVVIQMSGIINGRQVRKSIQGRARKVGTSAALGASQGIVGALAGAAIDRAFSKQGRPHSGLQQEFGKVRFELLEACDKAVGRKASKSTGRWKGIQFGAVVAGLLAFLAFFAYMKLRGDNVGTALVGAAFLIVPAAALEIGIGIAFMPDAFFLREAAGRRALRLSGASSPTAARIVGVITAILMLGLLIGIVVLRVKMK